METLPFRVFTDAFFYSSFYFHGFKNPRLFAFGFASCQTPCLCVSYLTENPPHFGGFCRLFGTFQCKKFPLKTANFRPFAGKCKGFAKDAKAHLMDYQHLTTCFAFLHFCICMVFLPFLGIAGKTTRRTTRNGAVRPCLLVFGESPRKTKAVPRERTAFSVMVCGWEISLPTGCS